MVIKEELLALTGNWIDAILLDYFCEKCWPNKRHLIRYKDIKSSLLELLSTGTISQHIPHLIDKGYLKRHEAKLRILEYSVDFLTVIRDVELTGFTFHPTDEHAETQ